MARVMESRLAPVYLKARDLLSSWQVSMMWRRRTSGHASTGDADSAWGCDGGCASGRARGCGCRCRFAVESLHDVDRLWDVEARDFGHGQSHGGEAHGEVFVHHRGGVGIVAHVIGFQKMSGGGAREWLEELGSALHDEEFRLRAGGGHVFGRVAGE